MGLIRKAQVAAAAEGVPGTPAALAGSNVIDLLEADWQESREVIERNAASGTLSKGVEAIGASDATLNATVDIKGSGAATTVPDYGPLLSACLMQEVDTSTLTTDASGLSEDLEPGDHLTGGTSGATAVVLAHVAKGSGAKVIPIYELSGTWAVSESIDSRNKGTGVGTSAAASPVTANQGKAWKPVSEVQTDVTTTAAWSASDPAAGEGVAIKTGATLVGEALIISVSGTATVLEMVWGTVTSGDTLTATSGNTATVTGTPSTSIAATVTARMNRDRFQRDLVGARGNVSMTADAGQPGRMTFTMQGSPQSPTDAARFTSGLPAITTTPPRFAGGFFSIDGALLPTRSATWDAGNNVVQIPDANSTDGRRGGAVTGRGPQISVTVDQGTVAGFDFWTKWKNGTTVTVGMQIGTTGGNRISLCSTKAQIIEISDADNDGLAGFTITFALRQETSVGDNEYFFAHT